MCFLKKEYQTLQITKSLKKAGGCGGTAGFNATSVKETHRLSQENHVFKSQVA